jgi:hypothetical protein
MVKTLVTAFAILLLCTFGAAHAASFTDLGTVSGMASGSELIYDAGQNLTWYVVPASGAYPGNPNPTQTTWANAESWAAGLTIDGKTGWMLPSTQDSFASGATGEMGTLFTELGNTFITGFANAGLFTNINRVGYWTSTTYDSNSYAWTYYFYGPNNQSPVSENLGEYEIAVHTGNVSSSVPIPGAALLFGPGLVGLAAIRRRFKI